jgi:hypothetical protein
MARLLEGGMTAAQLTNEVELYASHRDADSQHCMAGLTRRIEGEDVLNFRHMSNRRGALAAWRLS